MDPLRRWGGVVFEQMDKENAKVECFNALQSNPNDAHYSYLFARSSGDLNYAIDAANRRYAAAFYEIIYSITESSRYRKEGVIGPLHTLASKMTHGYNQLVLFFSFRSTYEFLKDRIRDDGERKTLKWVAGRAADAAVPWGHVALADFAESDAEKWFHLELAANLIQQLEPGLMLDQPGERDQIVTELRARASQIYLTKAEIEQQRQNLQSWTASDPLVAVPADIAAQIRNLQD
jgi:hypothetical protein